jgi:thiamine-monophosphate kinase
MGAYDPDPPSAEERLIARYFRPLAKHPGAFGLRDDAAALTPPPGSDLVLTADAIVGGVHFFPDDPPDAIAKKALRVNLSDLAAKGALPAGFLLTLSLPQIDDRWLEAFARGLGQDADAYACPLLGGDTDRTTGPVTVSIAAFGTLPQGTMVRRAGAKPGDRILATGSIGDAALGLILRRDAGAAQRWKLSDREREHLAERYLLPQPRNGLAETLRLHASAAMDVSDGLVGDLGKLCAASGVTAEIEIARVPLSDAAAKALAAEPGMLDTILTGGDDYEIVCAMAPDKIAAFHAAATAAGVAVAEIGGMIEGNAPPRFLLAGGKVAAFKAASFSHF